MSPFIVLIEAWVSISANRLRSFLTTLGIIIGIASVVIMLAIGSGSQNKIQNSINAMGSNLFIVLSGATTSSGVRTGSGNAQSLTIDDANAIAAIPGVAAAAPSWPGTAQVVYGSNNWSTSVNGVTESFLKVREWPIIRGEEFAERDIRTAGRTALLGTTVASTLFGNANPVGEFIRIKNVPFEVIGVLKSKGQSLDGRDQDDVILIPLKTAQRKLFGSQFPGSVRFIMVKAESAEIMNSVDKRIKSTLRDRHRIKQGDEDDFTVRNLTAVAESAASTAQIMSTLLAAIASISLLVGGIGIMNIMLVSVTERTREIGIRKAIGATEWSIMLQFLLEAIIISAIGSIAGLLVGLTGTFIAKSTFGLEVQLSMWSIVLSLAVASSIGIFFGFYPAHKAAKLSPIEALRHQ